MNYNETCCRKPIKLPKGLLNDLPLTWFINVYIEREHV